VLFADEYPDFMLQKGTPFRLLNALFSYFIVRKFSILAVISEALFNFWEPMLGNWQKLLKYPLTAKESDEIAKVSSYEFDYIFYSGFSRMRLSSKYLEKDEPEVLIKAFSLVNKLHGDVRLIISGQKSDILIESVKLLGLENRVIFVGKVVEAEYNQLIKQALACILPRPKTIQSKGSMPYRLGEYLLAGRFIISSDVGEIKQFVEGDKTVLFYTPGDYFDLAKQIELVRDAKKRIGLSFKRPLMEQKLNLELNSRELANLIKGESISH
jgi:glycosyltransferase involved in cell wall biosynthesis